MVAGGDGNWDSTTNWAATSGGASGQTAPTVADTVTLDSASGNASLVVNVSSACLSFATTGTYAGTVTFNAQLSVSGNITFIAGMTLAGTTGPLVAHAASTLTSGGKTIPCPMTFDANVNYTLADSWSVTGLVTFNITGTPTVNGASFKITCAGGLSVLGTTNVDGTAKLELTGGTWSMATTNPVRNNLDLNGNVTVSGSVSWGAASRTLKYVAGTITTTGSTLIVNTTGTTVDTNGVTWNSVTWNNAVTYTLDSDLAWSGTMTFASNNAFTGAGTMSGTGAVAIGAGVVTVTLSNTGGLVTTGTLTLPNAALTFAGTSGFTVGTLTTTALTASRTHTLTFGNTYTVTTSFANAGTTTAIRQALVSSSAGNRVVFNVLSGASLALLYCDPTDVNSSAASTVLSVNGTITNTLNWINSATATLPGSGSGRIQRSFGTKVVPVLA